MDLHGNMVILGGGGIQNARIIGDNEWPEVPRAGQIIFKDKCIYACVEVESDLPVWVPLSKQIEMLIFNQDTPSLEWVVNHSLQMARCIVQIYDTDGNFILANGINQIINRATISFSTPTAGTAILLRGNTDGLAPEGLLFEQAFTNEATWTINHALGFNPIVQCFIGDELVQPLTLTYPTMQTAVATFSVPRTGRVRCI